MLNATTRTTALSAVLLLSLTSQSSRADTLTLELPELTGTFVHGQAPISAVFDFGQPFVWGPQFVIEITGTGTPGFSLTGGAFPADLAVSVYYQEGPQLFYANPVGVFEESPVTRVIANFAGDLDSDGIPSSSTTSPGDSGQLLVVFESNPLHTDVDTPSTINITNVTMSVTDQEPVACFPEDPSCGGIPFFGIAELNLVLSNWNMNVPPADPRADWSGDGYIGIEDLNVVLSNWNAGTPPGAVPEPGTFALLGLMGLLPLRRCRWRRG